MSESSSKMLSAMAQHTGLNRETVKDLIKKGWEFERQLDTGRMAFFSSDKNAVKS